MTCLKPEDAFEPAQKLWQDRPVLLACEAIGWLHMAGKARLEFLRTHAGENISYSDVKWHDHEQPPFPWDDLLGWVKQFSTNIPQEAWPASIKEFTEKHRERHPGVLGLLQAAHGVTSGVEKNLPPATDDYLKQRFPHVWLSSPLGYPRRNLLADPPEVLSERGWRQLVDEMRRKLEELRSLASSKTEDVGQWARWREDAIGADSYIHRAFLSTVAETRLPNNDVTLWDQSYVAAALFKSAVAAVILSQDFPWEDGSIKQKVRWRLLTVAIGADHYEARAVKIGDWTGARATLDEFFARVAQLVEVCLAAGSLLYRDGSTAIFSFPGERFDEPRRDGEFDEWRDWLQKGVERIAQDLNLETPPLVRLSGPTRSLVPMVRERREADNEIAVPVHKVWAIAKADESRGHVCPVCRVRLNGDASSKGRPCQACWERRQGRLRDWLQGKLGYDTIWFEEVADSRGRLALCTFMLDLEPWLNGERVDSLRAQSIPEWAKFNPKLKSGGRTYDNPILASTGPDAHPVDKLVAEIKVRFRNSAGQRTYDPNDPLLANVYYDYPCFKSWDAFFCDAVEDRAEAPTWGNLQDEERALWLAFQLFRKLPSPGRVYRFWREGQDFFERLLKEFRQIAARTANPWRVRRLMLRPDQAKSDKGWRDGALYDGHLEGVPVSLVYLQELNRFVTACNLARLLRPDEPGSSLEGRKVNLREEDELGSKRLVVGRVGEVSSKYPHLGVYHPVIPLEVSPLRFRVILPLEAASECVDLAQRLWKEEFARVRDRLPLHVGGVAFERTVPFQALLEAACNLEDALTRENEEEPWRVHHREAASGQVFICLRRPDGGITTRLMPVVLPDGREDVFYPYLRVKDIALRFPRDFRHPKGQVYRHPADLQTGDDVIVHPARVAFLFMDSAGARFQETEPLYAEDWERLRAIWRLVVRVAPSSTALQRFRSALNRLQHEWGPPGEQASPDLWKDTVRGLLAEHLEAKGAALEELTEAAAQGILQRALEWHMTALKEG